MAHTDVNDVNLPSALPSGHHVTWYRQLWTIRSTLIVILTPICLLPVPVVFTSAAGQCAYAIMIMAVYWLTEVIPMAVTALLPVIIFPWLGVMETKQVCQNYLKDANMLFLGGLLIAVAVERWNLHRRIAMKVLLGVGSSPPWLMCGFMLTTAFLSMWISNTATAAMMIPIAHAVLSELNEHRVKAKTKANVTVESAITLSSSQLSRDDKDESHDDNDGQFKEVTISELHCSPTSVNSGTKVHPMTDATNQTTDESSDRKDDWFETVGKGMRLSIAYAANIGGTATLTGTGPNLVLKGQIDTLYGSETGINFSSWFVFAFPNMIISLFLAWFWLLLLFVGPREMLGMFKRKKKGEAEDSATGVLRAEYEKLGKMSFAEIMVTIHFVLLVLMWLFREPEIFPGWQSLLPKKYVSDSCVAITVSALLFIVPSEYPNYLFFRKSTDTNSPRIAPAILDWPTVHKNIPWNILLLLGGGFALADGCKVSKLSNIIGQFFISFRNFPPWLLVLVLSTLTAAFTEVTSNVATATIFLPILAELARSIFINPLYLMLPVTIACSFAFMLPVATPPNAIVFAYGNMKILDMMKAGLVMNIVCLIILQIAINTWGYSYFNLGIYPEWAETSSKIVLNSTTAATIFQDQTAYVM